jgi:hypothetical protein
MRGAEDGMKRFSALLMESARFYRCSNSDGEELTEPVWRIAENHVRFNRKAPVSVL